MRRRKGPNRVARRLKQFERCQHAIEKEVRRLISSSGQKAPSELRLVQTHSGASTLTFFVDCDGKRSYVLRCLLRRREVRHLPDIYAFCQENRVSTPRLFAKCRGFWRRIRVGFHLFLEEFIEAEPIEKSLCNREQQNLVIDGLATCLADLHGVTRSAYGPVSRAHSGPYLAYYVKKARQKLERIQKIVLEISGEETRPIERFLLDEFRNFKGASLYSLIHGDPSDGNVLVDKTNRVTLIDLEYMHFGIYQYDLQMVRHYLIKDDEELFKHFKQTYDLYRNNKAEESKRLENLCRVFVLLRSLPLRSEEDRDDGWWRQWNEIRSLAQN